MGWSRSKYRGAYESLNHYGRAHRRTLLVGLLGTLAVVVLRVAMPWPLRAVLEIADAATDGLGLSPITYSLVGEVDLIAVLAAFVAIGVLLGLAEMAQRVSMKRFAAATVRDMRSDAVRNLVSRQLGNRDSDLISRLVGDAARVKAELSGILVHVSQNALLFLGICLLFFFIAPVLGLFFLAGGVFAISVGFVSTRKVAALANKQREKEADYAAVVQDAANKGYLDSDSDKVNRSSTRRDVVITRTIARSSAVVHAGLAFFAAGALAFASRSVVSGFLEPGELFLFIAYVLTVHRRLVQVGRQLARSGKLMANVRRIASIAQSSQRPADDRQEALPAVFELQGVTLGGSKAGGDRKRLRGLNLEIKRGEKILVLGGTGAGKSSLLRTLAGLEPYVGEVLWDGVSVEPSEMTGLISFVSQAPVFTRSSLAEHLGVPPETDIESLADVLRSCSIRKLVRGAPKGLRSKVSSATLTTTEARGIKLCRLLLNGGGGMWLIDDPLTGSGRKRQHARLDQILRTAGPRTVVVSAREPLLTERFDRILVMKSGKIKFVGAPAEYMQRRLQRKRARNLRTAI